MSSDELTQIAGTATRGGLFLFAGNTAATVIFAIGAIIVARLLGPLDYGLDTLTVTILVDSSETIRANSMCECHR
jgi:hypothetical protein